MRVLIVKVSALGDIIHALPVLDYLHRVSPGIEIDWVVEEPFREVLEGNPLITQIHSVRTKIWRKRPFSPQTWKQVALLRKSLRERNYEVVFDIQGNLKSGLISLSAAAETRIGFAREDVRESINLFFTTRQIPLRHLDYHVTEKYLRLVSVPFGKDFREMKLAPLIVTSPDDDAVAEVLLSTLADGLVFLFHCGTSWPTKLWAERHWVELGKALLDRYADSSILFSWGNESERGVAMTIARAIGPGARVIDRYSLKGLAAVMKKVDLVVGGDTGPVHIAAAVGTPTVSFYRATEGKLTGPRGEGHVIVQSPLHCSKCARKQCDKDRECSESITVAAVMKGVVSLVG